MYHELVIVMSMEHWRDDNDGRKEVKVKVQLNLEQATKAQGGVEV